MALRTRIPAWALGLALGQPACSEFGPRIYTARPYQAQAACLAPSVALGVVQAEELASTCPAVCLLLDATLYVSVVCAPYPTLATRLEAQNSPDCALALGLFEAGKLCGVAPFEPADAGPSDAAPGADAEPVP